MNDNDKLATTDDGIWKEARDRLKLCEDAEAKNRSLAKADLIFREGEQWDKKPATSVSMETIELTINLTDPLVRRVVNNMKQQRPRGKCHPVNDEADIKTAQIINGLIRHIEYRSNASVAYDTAAEMAVTMGWGYMRMIIEYAAPDSFDQEIRYLPIFNPFTVYLDPGSVMPDGSDAKWGIISVKEKRTDYRRLYGMLEDVTSWAFTDEGKLKLDWESEEEIRLAEYFRIVEKTDTLIELTDPSGRKFQKWKDELPSSESMAAAQMTVTNERESARTTVELFKLNGTKVISKQTVPGKYIPIIRCQGNAVNIDGETKRRGMVRAMMDPQRMVNYGEVAKIKRLGLTPQAPWLAAEGQLDGHPEWQDANRKALPVLTWKPILGPDGATPLPPPSRQPPAGIEQGFSEFVGVMRSNLNAVGGAPNEPGQDTNGEVVSGTAISKRQGLSDQSHFQYYDNETMMIQHAMRITLDWIPFVYSEQRMQRIIGDDGLPQMTAINQPETTNDGVNRVKNDLTIGRYDVTMDTGPGYQTRREEERDHIMQLMGSPLGQEAAKVGSDLIFRLFDDPLMQQLADRLAAMTPDGLQKAMEGMDDKAKTIIQTLSKQLEQAKQQLQEAQAGITKAHIDATVKAHDTEEWVKLEREKLHLTTADNAADRENKLDVEHLKIGGEMIDSKNVRAHEKEMVGMKQLNEGDSK